MHTQEIDSAKTLTIEELVTDTPDAEGVRITGELIVLAGGKNGKYNASVLDHGGRVLSRMTDFPTLEEAIQAGETELVTQTYSFRAGLSTTECEEWKVILNS